MSTINLDTMTLAELKALAYDYIAQKEEVERVLNRINGTIAQRIQAEQQKASNMAGVKQTSPIEEAVVVENNKPNKTKK